MQDFTLRSVMNTKDQNDRLFDFGLFLRDVSYPGSDIKFEIDVNMSDDALRTLGWTLSQPGTFDFRWVKCRSKTALA